LIRQLFNADRFDVPEGLEKGLADFFFGRVCSEESLRVLAGGFDFGDGAQLAATTAADDDRGLGWLIWSLERRRATPGATHLHRDESFAL
jgi:hypothetical protein